MPQFLNFAEVCALLHLSRSRVNQLLAAGEFPPPHKLNPGKGGRVIWPREKVEGWIAERAPKAA